MPDGRQRPAPRNVVGECRLAPGFARGTRETARCRWDASWQIATVCPYCGGTVGELRVGRPEARVSFHTPVENSRPVPAFMDRAGRRRRHQPGRLDQRIRPETVRTTIEENTNDPARRAGRGGFTGVLARGVGQRRFIASASTATQRLIDARRNEKAGAGLRRLFVLRMERVQSWSEATTLPSLGSTSRSTSSPCGLFASALQSPSSNSTSWTFW